MTLESRHPDVAGQWVWTTVGAVASVDGGLTRNASKRANARSSVPLVTVGAVHLREIRPNEIKEIGLLDVDGDKAQLKKNDLLIVEGNGSLAHIGRVALWNDSVPGARHQNHLIRVRPTAVSPRLLLEWLASPVGRAEIVRVSSSTAGLYNLSISKVESIPTPLPPLNEQRRIVAKIEQLFAHSRRAKEALDKVPALLERLKKSILATAFRGDLTKEWREKNPNVEPASELLARIKKERRKKWEEEQLKKFKAKGKAPPKGWKEKYKEPEPVDASGLPELPRGWEWARLAALTPSDSPIVYGIILPGPHKPGGVLFVRPADIHEGTVQQAELPRTTKEIAAKYQRAALEPGDLIFSVVGTIGKWLVVPKWLAGGNITQSSVRIRPVPPFDAYFYLRSLQSPVATHQINRMVFGNAVQRLNVEHVRDIVVAFPPEKEWTVLAGELETALASARKLNAQWKPSQQALQTLNQSILAKAFRGELVPQDPNDEPASVLLERIREEREKAEVENKAKRKKKSKAGKKGRGKK